MPMITGSPERIRAIQAQSDILGAWHTIAHYRHWEAYGEPPDMTVVLRCQKQLLLHPYPPVHLIKKYKRATAIIDRWVAEYNPANQ